MRPDVNTCSSQPAMHHGVPVRVLFRRSSEHHSRNGSRIGTSWSHDSHVFSHSRTLVVPGTFRRVLYNNIHHHAALARELEEKEKNTDQDQRFHFSFSCGIVYSRGNRTPESEKKADVGISHQTENEHKKIRIGSVGYPQIYTGGSYRL